MSDIPPRLSEQQKFTLAAAYQNETPVANINTVSWAVAEEFDDDSGERILHPDAKKKTPSEWADATADNDLSAEDAAMFSELGAALQESMLPDDPVLQAVHSASFSRSLRRLEDRGLLERKSIHRERIDGSLELVENLNEEAQATRVLLTDSGEQAAEEIQRRAADGRYNLSFETEPW